MDKGQIIEEGDPGEILTNPSRERTKAFIKGALTGKTMDEGLAGGITRPVVTYRQIALDDPNI